MGWAGNPINKGVGPTHLQQTKEGGGAGASRRRRLQAIPASKEKVGWKRDGRGEAGMGWGRQPWSRREGAIERRRKLMGMDFGKRRAAMEGGLNSTQAEEVAQVGDEGEGRGSAYREMIMEG